MSDGKKEILLGDCLELMKDIPNGSIDAIICDLPYGVLNKGNVNAKWDSVIPFEPLWEQYERIIKDNGAIILFGQGMFSAELMISNKKLWRYNLIWDKVAKTGFLNANKMPMRQHEDILVFYKKLCTYNPQMEKCEPHKRNHGKGKNEAPTNSCYGKFGQQKYSNNLYMNGNELQEFLCNENSLDINAKIKNINILEELPNEETYFNVKLHPNSTLNWIGSCVKISSYIAAHARSSLYAGMLDVGLENIYYFDTDSIFTTKPIQNKLFLKDRLGDWKIEENNIIEAYFLNPKVYMYKTKDGKETFKCKGIPSRFLNREFFIKLMEEDKISIKNMKNIYHKLNKILFKEDESKKIEILDRKRIFHNDGDSEPYYNLTQLKENL